MPEITVTKPDGTLIAHIYVDDDGFIEVINDNDYIIDVSE